MLGRIFPKTSAMTCVICKLAETRPGCATVTLQRERAIFVVKDVPAEVCLNCGENYVDSSITAELLRSTEALSRAGAELNIRHYPAVA